MKSKLVVNCGGMFSGKSTELIRQGERHMLAGHKVVFIKPQFDDRYSEDEIVNHKGQKVKALSITSNDNILLMEDVMSADVVLIDEVQFLSNIVIKIECLLKQGKAIYCSGLDMDYLGKPFETVASLMALADEVNKFHAVCAHCGEDAVFSKKLSDSTNRFDLGEKDKYIPLCRKCYHTI